MKIAAKEVKSTLLFLLLVLVMSTIVEFLWIKGGDRATKSGISLLLMWSPGLAAIIVKMIYYRKEELLGWKKCKVSQNLLAIFIPLIYLGASYGVYWIIFKGTYTGDLNTLHSISAQYTKDAKHQNIVTIITLIAAIPSTIIAAMGEEIGWRGFLLPQMAKIWNVKIAILVTGVIWAVWHMPLMIAGLYNPGTSLWFALPMFLVDVVGVTVIMSLLRLKSKSVWPAILLHASHNYLDQAIFGTLTQGHNKAYFVGEIGIITTGVIIFIAIGAANMLKKENGNKLLGDINIS